MPEKPENVPCTGYYCNPEDGYHDKRCAITAAERVEDAAERSPAPAAPEARGAETCQHPMRVHNYTVPGSWVNGVCGLPLPCRVHPLTPAPAPGEAERDPGYMTPEERAEFNAITRRLTYPVKIVRKEEWERIQSQLAAATRERDEAERAVERLAAAARDAAEVQRLLAERAEVAERALRELRMAGAPLSNCAFNLAQRFDPPAPEQWAQWRRSLEEARQAWDKTFAAGLFPALPPTPTPPEGTHDA